MGWFRVLFTFQQLIHSNGIIPKDMLPIERRAMQGVWLFLLSLSVFFVSGIILYVVYIYMRMGAAEAADGPLLKLPPSFITSTLSLIGVSGFLELACRAAQRCREAQVKNYVVLALFFALLFMVLQASGLYELIGKTSPEMSHATTAFVFTFVLAFLHAAHVLFGILGLILTTFGALREKYDRERLFGLKFCTLYWHFLDIVWVLLLTAFIIAGYLLNK